ncbi:pentapeptide repeat-containing protein [Streptomyces lunaelactis]|uniref:pentapeptide repeat-containing protein n=1 Tax=Streptomyces lunaelactis TaxID=1535768 RepID=UPI001584AFCA|nr:pentapeptide repeat-containing protein [Streptomyces lunaelactis]NUK02010.1 pentapeptide repeat-containing protein [Streptomyces lunaelactis]NUK18502.1 pentapeptide repeat-containing protein [Streptomyces lunaelactis]
MLIGLGGAVITLVVTGAVFLAWRGPWWLDGQYLSDEDLKAGSAALVTGFRTTVVQLLAVLGAGIALLFTGFNYRLTRRGQVTDRFTKALERLGSDELYVRIGGVLALEQIVQDAPDQAGHAAQVLNAFVRERVPQRALPEPASSRRERIAFSRRSALAGSLQAPALRVALPDTPAPDVQHALIALTQQDQARHVIDLSGLHLAGANLAGLNLAGANLVDANLAGADLVETNFARAYLGGADLTRAVLRRANLSGADLAEANIAHAGLGDANMRGAQLAKADLTGASMIATDLVGARFQGTNLTSATLVGADLTGAVLGRANLTKADFYLAKLGGARFVPIQLSKLKAPPGPDESLVTVEQMLAADISASTELPLNVAEDPRIIARITEASER